MLLVQRNNTDRVARDRAELDESGRVFGDPGVLGTEVYPRFNQMRRTDNTSTYQVLANKVSGLNRRIGWRNGPGTGSGNGMTRSCPAKVRLRWRMCGNGRRVVSSNRFPVRT
jgi:hypothetical protein